MLKLSQRAQALKPSPTMEISAKATQLKSQGQDVISLAAGEPDFNTPDLIQKAATKAMAEGITRYTPAGGFIALREKIAQTVSRANDFPIKPEEVVVSCGAKYAIYAALQCLVEPGDTVLVPTPAWVSYQAAIELAGASLFPLPLLEQDGFRANVDRWKGMALPKNAKGIILNTPNNPTGTVYSREDLLKIVSWALQRDLWILADEVYEKILYDNTPHVSIASLGPEVRQHTITISSVSKTFAMTGWRVGWAIAEAPLVKKMAALQSQSISNVTSFAQSATLTALGMPQGEIDKNVKTFARRRQYCRQRLDKLGDFLSYVPPNGAFYFFINLSKWLEPRKMSDVDFCKSFLEKQFVGMVPGSAFGKEKFARMSYATSDANLEKAFDRLESFLKEN